jgi:hypothetical protein
MNPHLQTRTIAVFRHHAAFCALLGLPWVALARCAFHFALTVPKQALQASPQSTSFHLGLNLPNLYSHTNSIQIP